MNVAAGRPTPYTVRCRAHLLQLTYGAWHRNHGVPLGSHVRPEALDEARLVHGQGAQRQVQIEQVAPLLALVQGTELGSQELLGREGNEFRLSREPRILDLDGLAPVATDRLALPDVDLHLEPHLLHGQRRRLKAVDHGDALCAPLPPGFPQPGIQHGPHGVEQISGRPRGRGDEIDVLGVPTRRIEQELV